MLKSVVVLGFLAAGGLAPTATVQAHQAADQPISVGTGPVDSRCATAPVVWLPGALQIGEERQINEPSGSDYPNFRASSHPECALV